MPGKPVRLKNILLAGSRRRKVETAQDRQISRRANIECKDHRKATHGKCGNRPAIGRQTVTIIVRMDAARFA
jgi:hypothetical protein